MVTQESFTMKKNILIIGVTLISLQVFGQQNVKNESKPVEKKELPEIEGKTNQANENNKQKELESLQQEKVKIETSVKNLEAKKQELNVQINDLAANSEKNTNAAAKAEQVKQVAKLKEQLSIINSSLNDERVKLEKTNLKIKELKSL